MRVFVLMVLVLNVLFFGWQYISGLDPQEAEETVLVPSAAEWAAPSLELVREVPSIVIDVKGGGATDPATVVTVVESPVVEVKVGPVTEPKAASKPEVAKIVAAVSPVPVEQSESAAEKVDLVVPPAVALCYKAGPFKQRSQPQPLVAMAEQYGFDTAITARKVESLLGEWIYLTEYETIKPARADVSALKAQGIKDIAIARLGDGQLIISLGIFGKEASLKRRLQELRALGYVNYQTRKRYREAEEYWLVLSGFEGDQQRMMADELGVALSNRFPKAQLTIVGCR